MALMRWSDCYSVGVKNLDEQHAEFIELMNELESSMQQGQIQSNVGSLLSRLMTHAHEHFSTEERLMETAGFPGLAMHRVEHQALLFDVEEFAIHFKQGDHAVGIELLNFLRGWLINHLQQMDQKYSAWLNDHGIH
jgi:hemerythrin-like metal-binding protein